MLVLSRLRDEIIYIGDTVRVTVVDIRGDKVRLGIDAPPDVPVHRKEVHDAIQREGNKRPAGPVVDDIDNYSDIVVGRMFRELVKQQAHWSRETFGSDAERGPIGPLKHLAKEAVEAQQNPTDPSEYADCLILTLDASRRAGIGAVALLRHAIAKMAVNKSRAWPKPTSDEPVEHVREATP